MQLFPAKVRKLWNKWELRALVLISLSIQIFLIIFGSRRKRTVAKWMSILLWLGYLLADWAATLALGVLSNSEDDDCDNKYLSPSPSPSPSPHPGNANLTNQNDDLVAFWAPFLLLHLGGPDTITAFSLEDNELWLRHLLGLLFQVGVAFYIFIRTLPKTKLWGVTVLMFIAGIVKYSERTWALMNASRDNFRESMVTEPDPGPNYAKFMEEYSSKKNAGFNAKIVWEKEPESQLPSAQTIIAADDLSDMELISNAHHFFQTFKRLIVDLILTFHDRNESQSFFMKRTWKQAYQVIEIELAFIYEVLYTKAAAIHTRTGCIFRFFSVSSIVSAFLIFLFIEKKHRYEEIDIIITYVLLGGAIALEIWSLTRLLFSDWTIVRLKKHQLDGLSNFSFRVLSRFRPLSQSMWSNSMAQYNLIQFCLKDQRRSIFKTSMKLIHVKDIYDKYWYRTYTPVTNELKEFIFKDLNSKMLNVVDSTSYKDFSTCRGEKAIETALRLTDYDKELERSVKAEFDESILLWHIATDLCYYHSDVPEKSAKEVLQVVPGTVVDNNQKNTLVDNQKNTPVDNQENSREVSNYMLYLLVSRPFMLTAGIGQIRFGDTCAEAKKFFQRRENDINVPQACKMLLGVETVVPPIEVKGDRSKSVLFDACRLAKSLLKLEIVKRWEIINLVWLEMLYYAASQCRGNYHAQRLSAGGELLTVVWFLMAHLGIGEQYRVESGHARAKLIVEM